VNLAFLCDPFLFSQPFSFCRPFFFACFPFRI
jgi:hypothetical protein